MTYRIETKSEYWVIRAKDYSTALDFFLAVQNGLMLAYAQNIYNCKALYMWYKR